MSRRRAERSTRARRAWRSASMKVSIHRAVRVRSRQQLTRPYRSRPMQRGLKHEPPPRPSCVLSNLPPPSTPRDLTSKMIAELDILQKTWSDLADRTNGKGIDKDTFLTYVPLSGLLGERLFAQFDRKMSGYIDVDDFVVGLATCCRGNHEERVKFLFDMFDVLHDNQVGASSTLH